MIRIPEATLRLPMEKFRDALGDLYEFRGRDGQAGHLVVVIDCDPDGPSPPRDGCKSQTDDGEPTATAYFRNVEIREADG